MLPIIIIAALISQVIIAFRMLNKSNEILVSTEETITQYKEMNSFNFN